MTGVLVVTAVRVMTAVLVVTAVIIVTAVIVVTVVIVATTVIVVIVVTAVIVVTVGPPVIRVVPGNPVAAVDRCRDVVRRLAPTLRPRLGSGVSWTAMTVVALAGVVVGRH